MSEGITIRGLSKSYGEVLAVDRVDLRVAPGELFFLLGPSGCGKTTLLRCIAGLEEPSAGTISFGEQEVTHLPPHRREAALVFQNYALWPHLNVAQNIAFGLEERRIPKKEIALRVEEALELVKLPGFGNRRIDQMSGGQQQRVSLARALVVRPKCLLLDEPLSNLDARMRVEMRQEIRRIVKEHHLTAVYVTHDQEEALAMADRLAVMENGKLLQIGSAEEVYRRPKTAEIAQFMGETNLIHGEVVSLEGTQATVRCDGVLWRAERHELGNPPTVGAKVTLSIRPEAIGFGNEFDTDQVLTGRCRESIYLGRHMRYAVETDHGLLQVLESHPTHPKLPGEMLILSVRPSDVVMLETNQSASR